MFTRILLLFLNYLDFQEKYFAIRFVLPITDFQQKIILVFDTSDHTTGRLVCSRASVRSLI